MDKPLIAKKIILLIMSLAALTHLVSIYFNSLLVLNISKLVILLFAFILYLLYQKKGDLFFGLFLLSNLIANLVSCYFFYSGDPANGSVLNLFFVLTYFSLFNHLALDLRISVLFKKYFKYLIVSFIIGVLIFIQLNYTLEYHEGFFKDLSFIFNFSYNIFVVLVLVTSFLNFIYKKNKITLLLFLASVCLVFADFVEIASYYYIDLEFLLFLRSLLFLIGFYFVYNFLTIKKYN